MSTLVGPAKAPAPTPNHKTRFRLDDSLRCRTAHEGLQLLKQMSYISQKETSFLSLDLNATVSAFNRRGAPGELFPIKARGYADYGGIATNSL